MRKSAPLALVLIGLAALTGCGESAELKPRAGKQLPIAPYGRGDRPSPSKLLEPNPQASPVRNVELRQKSENRQDDPFDLPPDG